MTKFNGEIEIFKKILDTLPSSIYLKDKAGRYLWLNKVSIQKLEYKHQITDSIIGKTDLEVFPEESALEYIKNDKKVLEENKGLVSEEVVTLPNGEKLVQLSFKEPLYNDASHLVGLLGYTVDVSERKKIEEELKFSKIEAEKAKYIMTEFISNMGHDLTTSVSDIGIITQMLLIHTDEYPELKEIFETLDARFNACEMIRASIINATSITNLEVRPEKFSILQVLLELEKEFRQALEEKHLKLVMNPLKPKKEEFIETDKPKFHAILEALLSNAIKFTEQGQITLSVTK